MVAAVGSMADEVSWETCPPIESTRIVSLVCFQRGLSTEVCVSLSLTLRGRVKGTHLPLYTWRYLRACGSDFRRHHLSLSTSKASLPLITPPITPSFPLALRPS